MSAPRLSIGLPVYNGEPYVAASIDSLLRQSFGDFELIVCDNCSTDDTASIVESFAGRDPRVRLVRNERNIGASGNFNRTFDLASAGYFKWACADDWLADGFLEAAVAELDAHPPVVLCYGITTLVDQEGRTLSVHEERRDIRDPDPVRRFRHASALTGFLNVLQGVMRTSALRGSGMFGNFRGADEALVVELALRGPFHEIDRPMLYRRLHPAAASAGTTVEDRQDHLDPGTRGRFSSWYLRHSMEHVKAIGRSPLPTATRLRLTGLVLRRMVMQRDKIGAEVAGATRHVARRLGGPSRTAGGRKVRP